MGFSVIHVVHQMMSEFLLSCTSLSILVCYDVGQTWSTARRISSRADLTTLVGSRCFDLWASSTWFPIINKACFAMIIRGKIPERLLRSSTARLKIHSKTDPYAKKEEGCRIMCMLHDTPSAYPAPWGSLRAEMSLPLRSGIQPRVCSLSGSIGSRPWPTLPYGSARTWRSANQ